MRRRGIAPALVDATISSSGQVVPSVKGREIYQAIGADAGDCSCA
jgi:hypothetical protein